MTDAPEDQIEAVVRALNAALEPGILRGVYLYGSAVDGGLGPDSDLDVLAVADRPMRPDERQALVERILPLSGRATRPASWRPVELTVVVESDVRPWRYPPRLELQYGEWLRDAFMGDDPPGARPSPDLAILLTAVRAAARPLLGPVAERLLDPVPPADLRRAMLNELPQLLMDLEADTRNVVLTLARMWTTSVTGDVRSKADAAAWVLERLPAAHRPVLELARAAYVGERLDRWDDQRDAARAYVDFVADRIGTAAALPPSDASV